MAFALADAANGRHDGTPIGARIARRRIGCCRRIRAASWPRCGCSACRALAWAALRSFDGIGPLVELAHCCLKRDREWIVRPAERIGRDSALTANRCL
ncbi:hypothetical protein XAP412_240073 [Xanthomonas phaseoli pv. phaseoli]|uniref:Uncharacterized protein n=1 Tax=Xanthomonas campestris pv. phaseoli TaxID=317013 RepID=A0AB38DYZ9_XANCH|nr:hypothetical protein XAP6984_310074 [Xanthomonas phaseoli pv. phaseoli]SON82111.1 hypothetical protein XAP412_240073 [Xanthomonas phaseoli pv. phaseoli]SON86403.1 hypothetical protein XAP7430_260072 [Xanthomonas phaseoli pv. phaseoli]